MTLPAIDLDTRDFQALVSEARALIPRLAPRWTDHNPSDPGITLLELLAWLADQQIYRVGHVGERHRRAFAALLGVQPSPPRPARGLIWPTAPLYLGQPLRDGTIATPVEQPQILCRVELSLPEHVEQEIFLTTARQTEVSALTNIGRVDLHASFQAPRASFSFAPRRSQAESAGQSLELVFDRPLVHQPDTSRAAAIIALGIEVPNRPVAPPHLYASPPPWGPLQFEYRIGNGDYQPVETVADGTFALSVTGVVLIRLPASATAVPSSLRLRLDQGYFPVAPEIAQVATNVLPVRQARTLPAASIGIGSGLPDQTIDLNDLSELDFAAPGFGVQTEEMGEFVTWARTEDFCRHGPAERVYRVEPQRRRVIFGNGINGMVPGAAVPIRLTEFERTDGRRGNMAAGLQWRIEGVAVEGTYGRNRAPINGGEDASDAERITSEARAKARRRDVLLSDADLCAAAKGLPGFAVGRAEVIRRFYPQRPARQTRGARTLVVMPWRRAGGVEPQGQAAAPQAVPPDYPRAIQQALASRRMMGERLSVIAARRVRIRVEAVLLMEADRNRSAALAAAEQALNARLTDIPVNRDGNSREGGLAAAEPASEPWPLGRPVTLTEIETLLARVPGVAAVLECRLAREDQPFATVDIVLARYEVAVGGGHVLSARGETDV